MSATRCYGCSRVRLFSEGATPWGWTVHTVQTKNETPGICPECADKLRRTAPLWLETRRGTR
jgi:hypothetical protein